MPPADDSPAFENRLADPDAAFRLLVEAQRGLGEAESAAFTARLVLILANEIGDLDRLAAAIALARRTRPDE